MNKNVLVLHIGTPKTGTTALQMFLSENRQVLQKYGWAYPNTAKVVEGGYTEIETKNGTGFYGQFLAIDREAQNWKQMWNCIRKYLKLYNVILSAEDISEHDTAKLLTEIKKEYENIKVVVYLRRQDRYIESLWNQLTKSEICNTKDINEWRIDALKEGVFSTRYVLNYYDWLESLSSIVGKENVIVRVYETQQFEGERKDIVSDCFEALGISVAWEDFVDVGRINEQLAGNLLEIKRVMNAIFKNVDIDSKKYYKDIFMSISDSKRNSKSYLSFEERLDILDNYKAQNYLVAKEYLQREDGVLFYDKVEFEMQISPKLTPIEEDIIRVFTALLHEQRVRTNVMQLLITKGERKLACFGAGDFGKRFLEKKLVPIDLFIDNDEKKAQVSLWEGKEIVCAKNIENWSMYFIVITCEKNYYSEIEKQLIGYGLQKGRDYIWAKQCFEF